MHTCANILAILLMVAMPFLRPCACIGFTLWCFCESHHATENPHHGHEHSHDCDCSTSHHDEQPEPEDNPQPKDTPCGDFTPAVTTNVLAVDGVRTLIAEPGLPFTGLLDFSFRKGVFKADDALAVSRVPRGPPFAAWLLVAWTIVLRI